MARHLLYYLYMTQGEREEAHVARAERIHKAVMEVMAKERPKANAYAWRNRDLGLFQRMWDKPEKPPQRH